jgi:predicted DNA-binding transcriptional regulator AlpA
MMQHSDVDARGGDSTTKLGDDPRRILNTWKEIAAHVGRAVRTVQRYERDNALPVHRMTGADHGSVMAFTDEIDTWLNSTPMKERRYVRPTLIVLDRALPGLISARKLVLEAGRFNVLTAYSQEEAYSTAEKFDVDGFVVDHIPGVDSAEETCEALKTRYPKKPLFTIIHAGVNGSFAPQCADYVIVVDDPQELLTAVVEVFGIPRLA